LEILIGIDFETKRAKALLPRMLLTLIKQPIANPLGPGIDVAAVADESGAQQWDAWEASGQFTGVTLAW
jgi:hypothetical protein